MARQKTINIAPAAASLTGFASNVTGASFTLTANDSGDSLAHQVSIRNDTANDHSGKTVTLVGTDADGQALTEVVTGPGVSATVESAQYFLTLTSATPSATIGGDTFDIGWVDEVSTQTIPMDFYASTAPLVAVDVVGTINFTVQETHQDVLGTTSPVQNVTWVNITALASKTIDTTDFATQAATGLRVLVNSYSTSATLQIDMHQGVRGAS